MPDLNEISAMTLRALGAAEELRQGMSSKIASQEAELNRLRSLRQGAEQYRALVAKLASAGVVDRCNAVYLDRNVTDENIGEFISKLANAISDEPQARATVSPYEVTKVTSASKTGKDQAADECERKLRAITGR